MRYSIEREVLENVAARAGVRAKDALRTITIDLARRTRERVRRAGSGHFETIRDVPIGGDFLRGTLARGVEGKKLDALAETTLSRVVDDRARANEITLADAIVAAFTGR